MSEFDRKAASLGIKFRAPLAHPSTVNAPERKYSKESKDGLVIERDVAVPTRYGNNMYCDIFRPEHSTAKLAPVICWTPYGKQQSMKFYSEHLLHATGIKPEHISEHAGFEAADPAVFCPRGYAVINCDIPGLWYGEGKATFTSPLEAEAFYDLIEVLPMRSS
jgi:predicted acyl esterase